MLYLVKRSLCSKILRQIGNGISLNLHHTAVIYGPGCSVGINTGGMVYKIGSKGRILDLGVLQIPCQLVDDGADHFQMPQFFCTERGCKMKPKISFCGFSFLRIFSFISNIWKNIVLCAWKCATFPSVFPKGEGGMRNGRDDCTEPL